MRTDQDKAAWRGNARAQVALPDIKIPRPIFMDCDQFIDKDGRRRTVRVTIMANTVSPHTKIPNGVHISYLCTYGMACYNYHCCLCQNRRNRSGRFVRPSNSRQ